MKREEIQSRCFGWLVHKKSHTFVRFVTHIFSKDEMGKLIHEEEGNAKKEKGKKSRKQQKQ